MAPDASTMGKKEAQSPSDAFVERVKKQLSNAENLPEGDGDGYSSTIPQ